MHEPDYIVDPATGCWVWQKGTRCGYGRMRRGDKIVTAHVWYWEQEHGPVPEGLQLDHVCHTNAKECSGGFDCPHRRCVNPAHLEPVTRIVNVRRGNQTKLSRQQVAEIKAQPHVNRYALAATYGVGKDTIAAIRGGKVWRDIEPASSGMRDR